MKSEVKVLSFGQILKKGIPTYWGNFISLFLVSVAANLLTKGFYSEKRNRTKNTKL